MDRTRVIQRRSSIQPGMREVQQRWTPAIRQERAQEGRRRMQEFLELLSTANASDSQGNDEELWAVGALGDGDWQRLVRRCG